MKRVFGGDRDEHGVLHLGSAEGSACKHCGAGGIPVLSTDGRTCWWRVPLDCCDRARARQARGNAATRTVYKAQAVRTENHPVRKPYKEAA